MMTYNNILTVIYLVFVAIITVCVVWNTFKTKKITDKVVGAVALVMLLLRLFLIK